MNLLASTIDKIIGLVSSRYTYETEAVEKIRMNAKDMIKKVIRAESFEEILGLENEFKTKVTLPTYELFIKDLKKLKESII